MIDLSNIISSIAANIDTMSTTSKTKARSAKPVKAKEPKEKKPKKDKKPRKSLADISDMKWEELPKNYHCIRTEDQCKEAADTFIIGDRLDVTLDTETDSKYPHTANIVGLSIYNTKTEQSYYFPFKHIDPTTNELRPGQIELEVFIKYFKSILEDSKVFITNHNLKFDDHIMFYNLGIDLKNLDFDTQICSNIFNEEESHVLKDLVPKYLKVPSQTFEDMFGSPENFKYAPLATAAYYGCKDAELPWLLRKFYESFLEKPKFKDLAFVFYEIEMPLVKVLCEMERFGIDIDPVKVEELKAEYETEISRYYEEILRNLRALEINKEAAKAKMEELEWAKKIKGKEEKLQFEAEIYAYKYAKFLYELAEDPKSMNLNSSQQLKWLLYDLLKLPKIKVKGKVTTGSEAMNQLESKHPMIAALSKYKKTLKCYRDFVVKAPTFISHRTGKVHSTFNQYGAKTGRFSSKDPNLQQIPKRDIRPRKIYIPPKDHWLVSNDYSQMELRILAHMSGDPTLCKAYQGILIDEDGKEILDANGDTVAFTPVNWYNYIDKKYNFTYTEFKDGFPVPPKHLVDKFVKFLDVHTFTASQVFGVPYDEVTKEMRSAAKAINFGLMYGMTSNKLSATLGISREEAQAYIDAYFTAFKEVKRWIDETIEVAHENLYVTTVCGRKRRLPNLASTDWKKRSAAERESINAPIQGSNADIIKIAMYQIHNDPECKRLGVKMLIQIHDELIWVAPKEHIEAACERVTEIMVKAYELRVPLSSDSDVQHRWSENINGEEIVPDVPLLDEEEYNEDEDDFEEEYEDE